MNALKNIAIGLAVLWVIVAAALFAGGIISIFGIMIFTDGSGLDGEMPLVMRIWLLGFLMGLIAVVVCVIMEETA